MTTGRINQIAIETSDVHREPGRADSKADPRCPATTHVNSPLNAGTLSAGARGTRETSDEPSFFLRTADSCVRAGATTRPSRAALLEGCFQYVTSRLARRASDTHTDTPSKEELSTPTFRRVCCREARIHETTHGHSAPTSSSSNGRNY